MTKIELKYLLLIFVVFIAACIETDIYLPAFPDMMIFFGASEEEIQKLLTWNFLGIVLQGHCMVPYQMQWAAKSRSLWLLDCF